MKRLLLPLAHGLAAAPAAEEIYLDAKALFGRCIARDVRLSLNVAAVVLDENDCPAAGSSYKLYAEQLSDRV